MNKIPLYASDFKRDYLFIRGLNLYIKSLLNKLDSLNHGLFESKTCKQIKYYMKGFLREQEKGKYNLSNFIIPNYDYNLINNILTIKNNLDSYKLRYDFFCDNDIDIDDEIFHDEIFVDGKPYPGFEEFYNIFIMIFNQLKFNDSDSYSDSYSDREELDFSYTKNHFEYFFSLI